MFEKPIAEMSASLLFLGQCLAPTPMILNRQRGIEAASNTTIRRTGLQYVQSDARMIFEIEPTLASHFRGLRVVVEYVDGVRVENSGADLQRFKEEVLAEVRQKYSLESLKDVAIFRAYRDFFWKIGIDPTKIRPAAEALVRRILAGKPILTINNVVDSYNLASIRTEIALAAFNRDELKGRLLMRTAEKGERFLGIGMSEPMELNGAEVVISDEEKLVAVYPYRDADKSKVSSMTRNLLILVCGVPGIDEQLLLEAGRVALDLVPRFCGGEARLV
jgi:DNA/RNA-binding domain of Phe-tRNA-synthetase-like protein